jgi:hypothetical protein
MISRSNSLTHGLWSLHRSTRLTNPPICPSTWPSLHGSELGDNTLFGLVSLCGRYIPRRLISTFASFLLILFHRTCGPIPTTAPRSGTSRRMPFRLMGSLRYSWRMLGMNRKGLCPSVLVKSGVFIRMGRGMDVMDGIVIEERSLLWSGV